MNLPYRLKVLVYECLIGYDGLGQGVEPVLVLGIVDAEFKDACPMKGTKRNRTEIAKVVCQHICDEWGGTFDEVTEYTRSFMTEFYKLCGIEV